MAFTIDTLTAITQKYIAPRVVDNTFKGAPFAYWMREEGRLVIRGGRSITQPIIKAQLNSEMYDGLDPATLEQLEPFTSAEYQWKWGRVPFVIQETDIDKNSGDEGVVDIVQATEETAKLTMIELLSSQLFGTNASAPKSFDGLQDLFAASGTSYGGLLDTEFVSPATWLTQIRSLLSAGVLTALDMRLLRGQCTKGAVKPNLGLCNFPTYAKIWAIAQGAQRFGEERMASLGFDHIMFEDMAIMPDEHASGSGTGLADNWLMFLNTDYLKLVIHANKQFISRVYAPVREIEAYTGKILFGGDLIATQRRAHGVYKAVNPAS